MKTIKFTPYRKLLGDIYERQTRNKRLQTKDGRYQFLLEDTVEEADFWVVQGKGIRCPTTCRVAPQNTIMLEYLDIGVFRHVRNRLHTLISTSVLLFFLGLWDLQKMRTVPATIL